MPNILLQCTNKRILKIKSYFKRQNTFSTWSVRCFNGFLIMSSCVLTVNESRYVTYTA